MLSWVRLCTNSVGKVTFEISLLLYITSYPVKKSNKQSNYFNYFSQMHIDLDGRREAMQIQTREPIRNNAQTLSTYSPMNGACL